MGAQVHSTAEVHASAVLEDGVEVGAGAFVGPDCVIGAGTRIREHAVVVERTRMGESNDVHPGAVLGGDPQDRSFESRATGDNRGLLLVGSGNVFREGSTFNRGAGEAGPTRVGDSGYFMTCAHAGHNCVIGDHVTMANCAVAAGHVRIGDGCFLSAHVAVHQFCDVGEMTMFQANSGVSMHAPPYVVLSGPNGVVGLNRIGLRRSGRFGKAELGELKEAFRLFYGEARERSFSARLEEANLRAWGGPAGRFVDFMREAASMAPPRDRGVCRRGRWADDLYEE